MQQPTPSLQSLASMTHELTRAHDLNDVLETAAEHAREALAAASVSIGQVDPSAEVVRTVINVGDLAEHEVRWPAAEIHPIAGDSRLTATLLERRSWADSITHPDCDPGERRHLQHIGKGSSLGTPIVVDGQTWGEFFVTRHVDAPPFRDEAVAYAEVVAAIMSSAVSWALHAAKLQTMAFHDDLTGLYNRRGLNDRAARLFAVDTAPREVAIVAVDLNDLKRVNDTEGHARGDQEIRRTAFALLSGFSHLKTSVVARVGGDEFAVLVADDDALRAQETMNDVCRRVASGDSPISLSAGIARAQLTGISAVAASELFAAADEALYAAKRARSPVAVLADDLIA